jgi:hypothetical protein
MKGREIDRQRREWPTAPRQRALRTAGVDAGRHGAVLRQPVGGVLRDDVRPDANGLRAMRPRPKIGLGPRFRKRMDAPPLGGKLIFHHPANLAFLKPRFNPNAGGHHAL